MSGTRCQALYPFSGERHRQGLRFAAGELITVLQVPDGGWWEGQKEDGLRGWFPASYVQLLELEAIHSMPLSKVSPQYLLILEDSLSSPWSLFLLPVCGRSSPASCTHLAAIAVAWLSRVKECKHGPGLAVLLQEGTPDGLAGTGIVSAEENRARKSLLFLRSPVLAEKGRCATHDGLSGTLISERMADWVCLNYEQKPRKATPQPGEDTLNGHLPPGWQSYMSPQGRRYYVNTFTNVNGYYISGSPVHQLDSGHTSLRKASGDPQVSVPGLDSWYFS
ncbi:hypothetical protein TURU_003124 [Turdus rufiventris]|nr:hypothetical protein TURU_003124 [Turdus rufiventris]